MKKIILLLTVFSMVFASCDPLEDINTEIDAQQLKNGIVSDVEYKLENKDYTNTIDKGGLGLDKPYVITRQQVKDLVPSLLASKYPVLGVTYKNDKVELASSATVTFNFYNPIGKTQYTVLDKDYASLGLSNLTSDADFNAFFDYKFPSIEKGSIVDLTYKTLAEKINYILVKEDYALIGNGKYNNFDIRIGKDDEKEEVRAEKIQTILKENFPETSIGQQYSVEYAVFDGKAGTKTMLLQLNASGDYDIISSYTLVNADYALVGNGKYNNFDIRAGKDDEKEEVRVEKIQTVLLKKYPSAKKGDQYFVTYNIYDGTAGIKNMLLEFNGTGYSLGKGTLISKTSRFTFIKDWKAPTVLSNDDYQAMGQKYDNFNGKNVDQKAEAKRLIEIYLGVLNPFAAKDDFKAIEYKSYEGGGVTATENVNFSFDGNKWNAIKEVIEETIKFGHDGTTWVPDNTIKYTLVKADYTLVGNGKYNNFDIRTGKDEETVESRLTKINTILLNNFSSAEEGQKYAVSYAVYDGSNKVLTMKVIKTGGVYILQ